MIGLGAMGRVLATLLIEQGKKVSVWNRSEAKTQPFTAMGAGYTPNIHEAVAGSDLIIICVLDYHTTTQILHNVPLHNKTIVQLSTGTPQDARQMAAAFTARGAAYLDGAILATPSQMGNAHTPIFLSGSRQAFTAAESALRILGGGLSYMGEAPGAASAWDIAALSSMFGMMIGFFNGARIIESEGMQVAGLGDMIHQIAPVLGEMVKETGHDIQLQRYDAPESSLDICAATFELMVRLSEENNLNSSYAEFMQRLFRIAQQAGFGQERLSALIKILR